MLKKVVFVSLMLFTLLFAQKDTNLKTYTKLGYISTQGNTKTENFSFDTKWEKRFGKHGFTWLFDAEYGKAEDASGKYTANKNKYFTELGYNYSFTDHLSCDYLVGYKHDKFSAYEYQFYTGPGAKYQAVKTKTHKLFISANILFSRDKHFDTSKTDNYSSLQAKGEYTWQITKNLKFEETASYRSDLGNIDNYFVYSDSELSSKISDILFAGIGYKIDYANLSGDKKHTDKTFLITLAIDY